MLVVRHRMVLLRRKREVRRRKEKVLVASVLALVALITILRLRAWLRSDVVARRIEVGIDGALRSVGGGA